MSVLLTNATVYRNGKMERLDVAVDYRGWSVFEPKNLNQLLSEKPDFREAEFFDLTGCVILPGFADVHVHFREPGFSYKETILTGSKAAAHGGFTQVMTMPNLNPAPATLDGLQEQLNAIRRGAFCRISPYGTITKKGDGRSELADLAALAPYVCGFSDDGKGIQDAGLMREAMAIAKELGKVIAAHCEDESLVGGADLHDGAFAKAHGLRGISSESEWKQVERDIKLADETGCKYHVCHLSTKESVQLVRDAKASGVDVTCETGPHYLTLTDAALAQFPLESPEIARFKMYPPLRDAADREALVEGLVDGTIDMIATDHAPHSAEEKGRGLHNSANGIIGLETAFPVMYTKFVETGILTLPQLVEKMAINPKKRFDCWESPLFTSDETSGKDAPDLTVQDLDDSNIVKPEKFETMGRSTPFEGWELTGRTVLTMLDGRKIYE